ncbi:MAG: hypothetical protein Q7R81_05530 [Candidatus Peregrinibacteria bacterium]|nr:hypothetical protein [Candidatus Peregrinibacteria bacterium]
MQVTQPSLFGDAEHRLLCDKSNPNVIPFADDEEGDEKNVKSKKGKKKRAPVTNDPDELKRIVDSFEAKTDKEESVEADPLEGNLQAARNAVMDKASRTLRFLRKFDVRRTYMTADEIEQKRLGKVLAESAKKQGEASEKLLKGRTLRAYYELKGTAVRCRTRVRSLMEGKHVCESVKDHLMKERDTWQNHMDNLKNVAGALGDNPEAIDASSHIQTLDKRIAQVETELDKYQNDLSETNEGKVMDNVREMDEKITMWLIKHEPSLALQVEDLLMQNAAGIGNRLETTINNIQLKGKSTTEAQAEKDIFLKMASTIRGDQRTWVKLFTKRGAIETVGAVGAAVGTGLLLSSTPWGLAALGAAGLTKGAQIAVRSLKNRITKGNWTLQDWYKSHVAAVYQSKAKEYGNVNPEKDKDRLQKLFQLPAGTRVKVFDGKNYRAFAITAKAKHRYVHVVDADGKRGAIDTDTGTIALKEGKEKWFEAKLKASKRTDDKGTIIKELEDPFQVYFTVDATP